MATRYDSSKHGGRDPSYKVRESGSRVTGDKFGKTDSGHTHDSYNYDRDTGRYSEYRGGDKSSDRSYNK